jgi:hypothetical protein
MCVLLLFYAPRRFALINFGRAVKKTNEFEFQIWRNHNGKNEFLPSRIIFVCMISVQKVHTGKRRMHIIISCIHPSIHPRQQHDL